jgi:hypothetical protein
VNAPGGRYSSLPARVWPLPVVSTQTVGTTVRSAFTCEPDRLSVIELPPDVLPVYATGLAALARGAAISRATRAVSAILTMAAAHPRQVRGDS